MTSVGAPPRPASRRHTESSRGCTALLLPEPGRATSGPRRLFSRSIVCAARGEALPEIEVRMSISGTPGRELPGVMTAYELVAALLPAGLGAAARRERTNAGRTTINVVARLFLVLATVHKTPSAPARVALCAALTARNAAIEGDAETVDAFSRTWLGLSHPAAWRKAVEAALLGDWVEALGRGLATDDYVQALLDRHTRSEHRALQPLWERRVRGKRTALLGQPLSPGLSVQDLLTEQHTPEDAALAAELADSRLLAVLHGLAPDEAALARAWAASGESWARTALDAGLSTAHGERVRRKLKRLGTLYTARAAAAGTAATRA
ncbi:hypothetical protein ACFV8Z_52120 [Streptomyces sp. NPDC059837]|uniref:hypothetical protein n=1 Tax=unclassified Streptomyces TaxID=2593676 RepID=UPI00364FE7CB